MKSIIIFIFNLIFIPYIFASFERLQGDAKFYSRGRSMAAGVNENASVSLNPASIASIDNFYLSFNYLPGIEGLNAGEITTYNADFVCPKGVKNHYGNFGIGYNYLSSSFYFEQLIQLIYANDYKNVLMGISFNYYRIGFEKRLTSKNDPLFLDGDYRKSAIGFNLGLLFLLNTRLSVGITGKNIYTSNLAKIDKEQAVPEYRTGFYYVFKAGKNCGNVSFDVSYASGFGFAGVGIEQWMFYNLIALRTGINTESFSLGAGFRFKYVVVNYSWELWLHAPQLYQQNIGLEIFF